MPKLGKERNQMAAGSRPFVNNPITPDKWAARYLMLCVVIAVIIASRDITALVYPQLRVEDGRDIFAYFYSHHNLLEVFRFKAGYIPLVPNIIGYLLLFLPARIIPYAFALVPLLFSALVYSLFSLPAYRYYLGSDLLRAVACLIFAFAPVFHLDIQISVDYIIWNLLLALIFLSLPQLPKKGLRLTVILILLILLIWSNPLSIILAPLYAWRAFTGRGNLRYLYLFLLASLLAYQAFGVQSSGVFSGLSILEIAQKIIVSLAWSIYLFIKQAYKGVFGVNQYMQASRSMLAAFGVALVFTTLLYLRKRDPHRAVKIGTLIYFSCSIIFLSVLSRGHAYVGMIHYHMRYMFVPTMLTYILLLNFLEDLMHAPMHNSLSSNADDSRHYFNGEESTSPRPIQVPLVGQVACTRYTKAIGLASIAVLFSFYLHNLQMGYYGASILKLGKGGPYSSSLDNGMIVYAFFRDLEQAEKQICAGGIERLPESKLFAAKSDGDWPFSVLPRCRG
jgi:hypothetical protein